jgi:hypothetical protein
MPKCKNCNKWASFANADEMPRYCATHKKEGMINVTKRICNEADCKTYAVSGYFKCKKHGGGKLCNEPGCKSGAIDSKTGKCSKHGGGKRCNEPDCNSKAANKSDKCTKHGGNLCNEPGCKSISIVKHI